MTTPEASSTPPPAPKAPGGGDFCQLLTPVAGIAELQALLGDGEYWMQEKIDGERRIFVVNGNAVFMYNKTGKTVPVPPDIAIVAGSLMYDFAIDGELQGAFHAFDLLSLNGISFEDLPFRERYEELQKLIIQSTGPALLFIPAHAAGSGKLEALRRIQVERGEGVVFKRSTAPYKRGRNLDQRKYKFIQSGSFIVTGHYQRHSVRIALIESQEVNPSGTRADLYPMGSVAIPRFAEKPRVGAIIEVRYLAANQHALLNPVFAGVRTDVAASECTLAQIAPPVPLQKSLPAL